MKAAVYTKYGSTDVLQIKEVLRPEPKANEVLVKIHATSVTLVDTTFRSGNPKYARLFTGLFKPKRTILGTEFSGVVEATGPDVSRFSVGDRVFGAAPDGFGAHAQYIALPEQSALTDIPDNLGFEDTAVIGNGALTALPFLRDTAKLKTGQSILIIGASGSIGTCAVQLAAKLGAIVTGVCSTANVEMVRALGADRVIDYTKTDFRTEQHKYDVIFDTVGKSSFRKTRSVLVPDGIYVTTVPELGTLLSPLFRFLNGGKRAKMSATGLRKDADKIKDMDYLKGLMAKDELTAVIDRSYPLEHIATAHAYVELGHKRGNLVVTMPQENPAL